ncbi:hypothetical protein ASPWEDRAFT_42625 [Aspergillus wentii DTO 134E9]|uniref:Uncharacterized protein n=1 Tax=Aspergillus wentii DTO 134E9 TaxID=1073089 RepID=A0A1L9RCJ3_ASPWE|nr:uncharacterized protein ASPWEDRAFT_42625 [Aspergillus wentii DTO 134E9]KAI9924193.1 hypothetical protein MW887_007143 [Aspergillus wentii]OJJ32608.1 hypothetical protein ASPWEDRAFT_42625 [Aspergillus wentii DTO 134E9]
MASLTSTELTEINNLPIDEEWKVLLQELLTKGVKVSLNDVKRIWQLAMNRISYIEDLESRILWVETGNERAGLAHILKRHLGEFEEYDSDKLLELAEASTSVGLPMGIQGKIGRSRPIFALFFYGKPLGIAVQVGSNGFVVSMNKKSLDELARKNPQHGDVNQLKALLQESHSWPTS